jgi:hypothetical protein
VRDSVVAALVSVGDRAETDNVCSGLMRPPTVDVLPSTPSVKSLAGYAAAMLRGGASMLQFCTTIEAHTFLVPVPGPGFQRPARDTKEA